MQRIKISNAKTGESKRFNVERKKSVGRPAHPGTMAGGPRRGRRPSNARPFIGRNSGSRSRMA